MFEVLARRLHSRLDYGTNPPSLASPRDNIMTHSSARRSFKRDATLAPLGVFGLLAFCTLGADAQPVKDEKVAVKKDELPPPRTSIEINGYTRPGNPDDKVVDGKLVEVSFTGANVQKFKIMGGTVYFVVF